MKIILLHLIAVLRHVTLSHVYFLENNSMHFPLGAPEGTSCTATLDQSQQGECRTVTYCENENGNIFDSGNCWQAPYAGGGGTGGARTYGCCVGNEKIYVILIFVTLYYACLK